MFTSTSMRSCGMNRFILRNLFLLLLPAFLLAQNSSGQQIQEPKWELDATVNGVVFYHRLGECEGKKVVFLKFDNKNNTAVKISWDEAFLLKKSDGLKTENGLHSKELEIAAGKTVQASCTDKAGANLIVGPSQKSPVYQAEEIVQFNFKEIKVGI